MQSTPANNENQPACVCAELEFSSFNLSMKCTKYIVCEQTDTKCCSALQQIFDFALWFCQMSLNPESLKTNWPKKWQNTVTFGLYFCWLTPLPSSQQYLPPSSCCSVTQVLRLAVNLNVVDAAIEALRRAIGAGSQARGHHLRRHTWKQERWWKKDLKSWGRMNQKPTPLLYSMAAFLGLKYDVKYCHSQCWTVIFLLG